MPRKKYAHDGFAIALAWPATYCRAANTWYDPLLRALGICENGYHKVGHAATVIINKKGDAFYYDFGRYTTPFGYARARGPRTDKDIIIKTKAIIKNNKITNYTEILEELQNNPACHGEGDLHAGYTPIHFRSAYRYAEKMNRKPYLPYGPFTLKGTNCSRFARSVVLAGKPKLLHHLKLYLFTPLTPTPKNNTQNLSYTTIIPKEITTPFDPHSVPVKELKTVQPEPIKPTKVPEQAKWLSGVGCGNWFDILEKSDEYHIVRYDDQGSIISRATFKNSSDNKINVQQAILTYPSNCAVVTLQENNTIVQLEKV